MCHILTVGYYLAIKSNKILIHTTTWMNLENMLHKKASYKRLHSIGSHFYKNNHNRTIY